MFKEFSSKIYMYVAMQYTLIGHDKSFSMYLRRMHS